GHLGAYLRIREKEPDKVKLVAMCDPVEERAANFAKKVEEVTGESPSVYTDVDEMLAKENLDGADICTPHAYHHINGIACLEAGVNVIIEKPFGVTIKASKAIIEAAKRNGKIAATAENIRRGLSQRTAWWLINEKGMLGEMRMFFAQHASWRKTDPSSPWHWRLSRMLGGGGMVMDSGAHFCDTIRYLFGDVDTVYAKVTSWEDKKVTKNGEIVRDETEDTWIANITFKSGMTGVWSCTWAAPGHSFTHVVYYGSEGCLLDHGDVFHGPFGNGEVILKDGTKYPMEDLQKQFLEELGEEGRNRLFPHGFMDGVTLECYDFLDAIQNDRPPEVDGETGMKAKAICEAIFESSFLGCAVKYDDVLEGKIEFYQKPINEYWRIK
ncbi:TPA: Gfo/Idh/MocA family oxidoreductase, partial [Candidatus Poribacteria bacterium]|nr:Gfo/Idh/MocA family oxidoreductase [Candidatus Poribacteria bacterium]